MSEITGNQSNLDTMRLCIEDDEGAKATYPLLNYEVRVGRDAQNDICLNQRNVSREHALFYVDRENHNLVIQDLDSYTGIKLNGKHVIGRCTMRLGDYLQIGDYDISLEVEGAGAANAQREAERIRQEAESALLLPEQTARLVVVSNNLAGREYHLNRAELIIGREPSENDLVINHRSISRVHAKIVWKNGEFTMIDLSSANGMKVNGSPFAAARLVRGAVVQLGMVKLRYVAPGEEYQPKSIAGDVNYDDDMLDRRRPTKNIMTIIAVFVVMFFLTRACNTHLNKQEISKQPSEANSSTLTPAGDARVDDGASSSKLAPSGELLAEESRSLKSGSSDSKTAELPAGEDPTIDGDPQDGVDEGPTGDQRNDQEGDATQQATPVEKKPTQRSKADEAQPQETPSTSNQPLE